MLPDPNMNGTVLGRGQASGPFLLAEEPVIISMMPQRSEGRAGRSVESE